MILSLSFVMHVFEPFYVFLTKLLQSSVNQECVSASRSFIQVELSY